MTKTLTEMRQIWRPRLAMGVTYNAIAYPWAALVVAFFNPDAGVHAVALAMALFGLAASLIGLRQWGKNKGVED